MDETDPVARAQHQLRDDLELVQRYGRDEAADHFGGCYWDNEPLVTIVALFTAEVDRHRTACCAAGSRSQLGWRSRPPHGPGGRSKPTMRRSPPCC